MAQQQPPTQPGMNGAPGFSGDPSKAPAAAGQWSSGLFDCFTDLPSCLITYFCACIGHGMVQGRAEGKPWGVDSILFIVGAYLCCAHCWYFGTKRRRTVREKYGLPEDPCGDLPVNCCCLACAVCQEWRELDRRGASDAGNPF
eukprot:jgi/Ulvmu1/1658/UM114_0028.1